MQKINSFSLVQQKTSCIYLDISAFQDFKVFLLFPHAFEDLAAIKNLRQSTFPNHGLIRKRSKQFENHRHQCKPFSRLTGKFIVCIVLERRLLLWRKTLHQYGGRHFISMEEGTSLVWRKAPHQYGGRQRKAADGSNAD